MVLKNFRIFNLTLNSAHLGILESGIINFFLNPSIALIPLVFPPLHHLVIVVLTSFPAYQFSLSFIFNSCLLKLVNFLQTSLFVILYSLACSFEGFFVSQIAYISFKTKSDMF